MTPATSPLVVLSYIGGPALLTNATSVLLLGTGNRLGRVVDRSRHLVSSLAAASPERRDEIEAELVILRQRLAATHRALTGLYVASAMFALMTMLTIVDAAAAELWAEPVADLLLGPAVLVGLTGFVAFVTAAASLVIESRLAVRALRLETAASLAGLSRARGPAQGS